MAQFLADTGLPPTLVSPLNFYASTVTLQELASFTAVWVGIRNSLAFTVFRLETKQITGQGTSLPPALQFGVNNTQSGGEVSYTHRLTAITSLVASAIYSTTTPIDNATALGSVRTKNINAAVAVSTQFTPKTNGSVGVTYFRFETPGSSIGSQSTLGVYASIFHTF